MSNHSKVLCERGKFFIETGTANTFKKWIQKTGGATRYIRPLLISRIASLINTGERDNALILWTKCIEDADAVPSRVRRVLFFYASFLVVAAMATYAFLHTLLN